MSGLPALQATDIESIERATLDAVAPRWVEALEEDAWLLPMDPGTVGRARSAVPLRHEAPGAPDALIDRIETRYAARDLPVHLRIADAACFDGLAAALAGRGYASGKPTLTQVGSLRAMREAGRSGEVAEVVTAPDAGWTGVFLGPGFDPVDGACRVEALTRARGNLFASVRENGVTVAAGAVSLGHGWAGVHGMRTEQSARGRGLAGRVLAGLAQAALDRGFERVFLQVEAGNEPALALYRRAGFRQAWAYSYWHIP